MEAVKVLPIKPEPAITGFANFESERVLSALPEELKRFYVKIELPLLKRLPYLLRERELLYALLIKEEKNLCLIDLFPDKPQRVLGCAIDLGSTTIAFYIYDFISQQVIKEFSIENPQISIGQDILTRLHFAKKEENLKFIQEITLSAINEVLEREGGEEIYFVSLCGNTAMTHFLLGLPVNYLIVEPYVAVVKWIPLLKACELGLKINPKGRVFVFPLAGTYFGGDLIAGLYEVELKNKEGFSFYLDVGTNAEVVLGGRDFLLACAGAAGPALEGGIFECGMQAKAGAIEKFIFHPEKKRFEYQTIDGVKPVGFCGSAVIQLIAELFLRGFLTPEGKFERNRAKDFLFEKEEEIAFLLVSGEETQHGTPVYIKESEIKSFLRSKGAMYSILSLLCEKVGISLKEVEKFYVAGTFGNHIDIKSAVILGMLPEEALFRANPLGNAAGKGALKFLRKADYEEVKKIIDEITYIELNVEPRFMELLTGALIIPHVNMDLFPQVRKLLEEHICFKL